MPITKQQAAERSQKLREKFQERKKKAPKRKPRTPEELKCILCNELALRHKDEAHLAALNLKTVSADLKTGRWEVNFLNPDNFSLEAKEEALKIADKIFPDLKIFVVDEKTS